MSNFFTPKYLKIDNFVHNFDNFVLDRTFNCPDLCP